MGLAKSTLTATLREGLSAPIIDPDAIARDLRPDNPGQAAVEAGREALKRQAAHLDAGSSFIIETTLSGATILQLMEQARRRGFVVRLIFVALDNPWTNIKRVAERVANGGHYVPDEDVLRRYDRSMRNLARAIELADRAILFDNSTDQGPREALAIDAGQIIMRSQDLPAWVTTYLGVFIARHDQG